MGEQRKAKAKLPPPRLALRLPSGDWSATFISGEAVEIRGDFQGLPFSVVLNRVADRPEWKTRPDFHRGPLQKKLETEFAEWVRAHPNFIQFAGAVEGAASSSVSAERVRAMCCSESGRVSDRAQI